MGGYGSGRPGSKQKADDCRALDIYRMKRAGCLEAGSRGNWIWSRNGKEFARVGYHCVGTDLTLDYQVRLRGREWEPIKQTVPLTQADCNYGGQRIYARCPGVVNGRHCGRRVGKLFAGGRYFLCRHCYGIAYTSQSEPRYDRMLRRANKLRKELGGKPGTAHLIAAKPKGMWWRTYEKKRFQINWCETEANLAFIKKFEHILSREERALLLCDVE